MSDFFQSTVFLRLVQFVGVLVLLGALVGITFVVTQMTRAARPGTGDRNWRFLFWCWGQSVAIMILYASVNFSILYDRFAALISALGLYDPMAKFISSQYLLMIVELVIYSLIMIISIRLYLRIRRFLEHS